MENGQPFGTRTDHDRDAAANGVGDDATAPSGASDLARIEKTPTTGAAAKPDNVMNGGEVGKTGAPPPAPVSASATEPQPSRMNDLPEEIVHITQGFVPLSLLLTRLAQTTHNSLQDKIVELAKLPVPTAAVNGNSSSHSSSAPDDTSNENLRKKAAFLNFIQDEHAKWVKALVITEWSRKSEMVSKLIDLKFHIDQQRLLYDNTLDDLVNVKRNLNFARMPSPDLKTALQVLATGSAPWMPDLQYIEPPPLPPAEQAKWMNELDTLLSLRLNIEDYDKIPQPFRDYEIGSGRVTFKVRGEFEVDLTIADEDPEKQFWFIDFRFAFNPSASRVPVSLRNYLEGCVNDTLAKDGLAGCCNFLHEFVLTSKINELKRQALQLSRSSWTGTLQIEPLNRALAIQYWTARASSTGSKSWVLVAINSGRSKGRQGDGNATSYLVAKWYRDNKEVKDVEIPLDVHSLSAEKLLRTVIGRHIEFTLRGVRDKLLTSPRFRDRQEGMVLQVDETDLATSSLVTQVGYDDKISMLMEPTTGYFAVKPQSKFTVQFEHQLNSGKNSADDGAACLENIRCGMLEDKTNRQASAMGWKSVKSPLNIEETRSLTKLRDWTRTIWLTRQGWGPLWFVVVILSLGGDEWWLVEAHRNESTSSSGSRENTPRALRFHCRLPLNKGQPDLSEKFWNNLTTFATGMITQSADLRQLHQLRIKSRVTEMVNSSHMQQVMLPSVEIGLAAIFPAMVYGSAEAQPDQAHEAADQLDAGGRAISGHGSIVPLPSAKQPWARDKVTIIFKGVQSPPKSHTMDDVDDSEGQFLCTSEAVVSVLDATKFSTLKGLLDGDVMFDHEAGTFSLRIQHQVGDSAIGKLKTRLQALDRFVNFMEAMSKAKESITSESITLNEIVFSYGDENAILPSEGGAKDDANRWRVRLDLSRDKVDVHLDSSSPHTRTIDMFKSLVNQDGGIGALLSWLPASLPAMKTLVKMECDWAVDVKKGRLDISHKTLDWIGCQYTLYLPDSADTKTFSLGMKLKFRRGEPWWHMWRSDKPPSTASADDEFDAMLKPIWNGKGPGWQGLVTGATGEPRAGVVEMLTAVNDAVRAHDVSAVAAVPPPQPPPPAVPAAQASQQQQQQQQRQQQQQQPPQPAGSAAAATATTANNKKKPPAKKAQAGKQGANASQPLVLD